MNHMHPAQPNAYSVKKFMPLIIIAAVIVLFTVIKQYICGFTLQSAMYDFMGSFFVVFSFFKIINIRNFAQAYAMYDILAQRSQFYAYAYPFIELALGIMYFTRYQLVIANSITLILMIIGSVGVARELAQGKDIVCACLGTVFKIPMTYVTLAEDILMGVMAALMLFF